MHFKELEKMKVDQLRAEAAKLEGVEGVNAMKKQELIDLLCEKLDIQRPEAQPEEKVEVKTADTESEVEADRKVETRSEAEAKPETEPAAKPAEAAKDTKKDSKAAAKKPSPYKGRLKALQAKRKQALADRDYQTLADVRMRIKRYRRKMKRESTAASSTA